MHLRTERRNTQSPAEIKRNHRSEYHGGLIQLRRNGMYCHKRKIDVIFAGAGLPLDLPLYLTQESKTKLVPIVSSSRAARIICEKWLKNHDYLPDAIVVEGPKAGGHLGFKKEQLQDEKYALEALIPEVVTIASSYKEKKNIPVIDRRRNLHRRRYCEVHAIGSLSRANGKYFCNHIGMRCFADLQRSVHRL